MHSSLAPARRARCLARTSTATYNLRATAAIAHRHADAQVRASVFVPTKSQSPDDQLETSRLLLGRPEDADDNGMVAFIRLQRHLLLGFQLHALHLRKPEEQADEREYFVNQTQNCKCVWMSSNAVLSEQ